MCCDSLVRRFYLCARSWACQYFAASWVVSVSTSAVSVSMSASLISYIATRRRVVTVTISTPTSPLVSLRSVEQSVGYTTDIHRCVWYFTQFCLISSIPSWWPVVSCWSLKRNSVNKTVLQCTYLPHLDHVILPMTLKRPSLTSVRSVSVSVCYWSISGRVAPNLTF